MLSDVLFNSVVVRLIYLRHHSGLSLTTLIYIPSCVILIRDTLINMTSLKSIIVENGSSTEPESCDFGKTSDTYNHIPIFKPTSSYPTVIIPYMSNKLLTTNYEISYIIYGGSVTVNSTNKTCEAKTFCYNTMNLSGTNEGTSYTIGSEIIRVMTWSDIVSIYGTSDEYTS